MNSTYIEELISRRSNLAKCKTDIEKIRDFLIKCYKNNGKVLVCGNGGSCSDAGHIVGELMKGFHKKRPLSSELKAALAKFNGAELAEKLQMPLRAIDLTIMNALNTAIVNDIDANCIYAQQVLGFADAGDVFIGISTSGNSENIHNAAIVAKAKGAILIGFTGANGGKMSDCGFYDVLVKVPEALTYLIQEEHIAIYHAVCADVENSMFDK